MRVSWEILNNPSVQVPSLNKSGMGPRHPYFTKAHQGTLVSRRVEWERLLWVGKIITAYHPWSKGNWSQHLTLSLALGRK